MLEGDEQARNESSLDPTSRASREAGTNSQIDGRFSQGMTRFLFIADTHWGSAQDGYKVQPKYGERLPDLLAALRGWMSENPPVDFILHGGDMIHNTSETSITEAVAHFDLKVPVYLCLGNHDLTTRDGLGEWMRLAPGFFIDGASNYTIETTSCVIHVIPNQYGVDPYHWDKTQDAHFLTSQVKDLEQSIASHPNTTRFIVTHSPVHPIPPGQTGFDAPFHAPIETFTSTVSQLSEKHSVRCVLGAHSHTNMRKELNGVNYITVSSFVESPFEFKCFEISEDTISMTTLNLMNRIEFDADYNWDKTFAQGREGDRSLDIQLRG